GNPYLPVFREIEQQLGKLASQRSGSISAELRDRLDTYQQALAWARSMPPPGEVTLASEIVLQGRFGIPAIITDSTRTEPLFWHGVSAPDSLEALPPEEREEARRRLIDRAIAMGRDYEPIAIQLGPEESGLRQYIFYDDSRLV